MPCKYNDRSVFDPEKKKTFKEVRNLRKSLAAEKERLKDPKGQHPYDIAVNIQEIQEDLKILMMELRPHVVT